MIHKLAIVLSWLSLLIACSSSASGESQVSRFVERQRSSSLVFARLLAVLSFSVRRVQERYLLFTCYVRTGDEAVHRVRDSRRRDVSTGWSLSMAAPTRITSSNWC